MENGVMMQYFEWNLPNNGMLWRHLKEDAKHLSEIGVTAIWIPPAYKGQNQDDVGYGVYDLYDFGEFNQKGTVRTKYGMKKELKEAIDELHRNAINVYLDAVMNHKAAADHTEKCLARRVNPDNRDEPQSDEYEIECWVGFDFKGRADKYSDFKWHWYHFSGTDYDNSTGETGVFQISGVGKSWSIGVDNENGNYDYLMFADIDLDHPEVIEELNHWGVWATRELGLDGMRIDAAKHMNDQFIKQFLEHIRNVTGKDFYAVGEYWKDDVGTMDVYLSYIDYKMDLFDVSLHYNMHVASLQGRDYDLTKILDDTLVSVHPELAVTFVDNHDSQPGSSLESYVQDWFKPSAYALILLMKNGYPCIFYGDYYGMKGEASPHKQTIDILLDVRKRCAYGEEVLYFDHANTIGLVRKGDKDYENSGLALLISNGDDGDKLMNVGVEHAGEVWIEATGNRKEEITIGDDGNALFKVSGGKVAVWVKKD